MGHGNVSSSRANNFRIASSIVFDRFCLLIVFFSKLISLKKNVSSPQEADEMFKEGEVGSSEDGQDAVPMSSPHGEAATCPCFCWSDSFGDGLLFLLGDFVQYLDLQKISIERLLSPFHSRGYRSISDEVCTDRLLKLRGLMYCIPKVNMAVVFSGIGRRDGVQPHFETTKKMLLIWFLVNCRCLKLPEWELKWRGDVRPLQYFAAEVSGYARASWGVCGWDNLRWIRYDVVSWIIQMLYRCK